MASARSRRNDDEHALLAKARPLQQTPITAFLQQRSTTNPQRILPRSEHGTYDVKEVDVNSALTDCALPGRSWSLNPYTGCSHDCAYCYVPDVAHMERDRWGSYVIVKRNLPRKLSRELKTKEPRSIFLSSATDPYQPTEHTYKITQRSIELIAREDWPLRVLTRSPLVQRDIPLLETLTDVKVGLSIPTLNDEARRLIEPGAPPIQGRLNTIRTLADAGLDPYINLAPAYPLLDGYKPDDVAQACQEAGASAVYAGRWRYLDGVLPVIQDRLNGTTFEAFQRAVDDDRYYDRLFASLQGAFRRAGVPFHTM